MEIADHIPIPEKKWTPKKDPVLTRRQKYFADTVIRNPGMSLAKLGMKTLNTTTKGAATSNAYAMLRNPKVMQYLSNHAAEAEEIVVDVMRYSNDLGKDGGKDGAAYAEVARKSANDVLDRIHGRAKQQIEINSTHINIVLDLTGGASGAVPDEITAQLA